VGIDYSNDKWKVKGLWSVQSHNSELTLTHKCCSRWLFGSNLLFNWEKKRFTGYHGGIVWEPSDKCLVGLKHESSKKEKDTDVGKGDEVYQWGKFGLFFFHAPSAINTVGSEFTYNWADKKLEAKLGLTHKFDDNNTGKIKVNHEGKVDALLKHKCCESVTAVAVTSINVKDFANQKGKNLPLGVSFDLKL